MDCKSTDLALEVSVIIECARLLSNTVLMCVGTNTDVASSVV